MAVNIDKAVCEAPEDIELNRLCDERAQEVGIPVSIDALLFAAANIRKNSTPAQMQPCGGQE